MKKRCLFLLLLLIPASIVFSQSKYEVMPDHKPAKPPVNRLDSLGQRHGLWWINVPERMGEDATYESGAYEHGKRLGVWVVMNVGGDIISQETYRNDVLDGEVKYYELGKLYCIGHYRGLNPKQAFDTIVVVDPESQLEAYRIVPTDRSTMRHGTWKYFNPVNGALLKQEEYQVDELISKQEYIVSQKTDSLYGKWRNKHLPHRRSGNYTPAPDKQFNYNNVLKSD